MKTEPRIPDKLFLAEGERITEILRRSVRHALLEHKRAGNTVAVWEGGRVALIPAEAIQVDDSTDPPQE